MARPKQDRVKVNVYLQGRILSALKRIATIRGTTYSELIRQAAHKFVVDEGKKILEERAEVNAVAQPAPTPVPAVPRETLDDADPRER